MNNEPPIIIVDNRKLAPISRIDRGKPTSEKRSDETGVPFGIVDRVTISRAARQKFQEAQSGGESASPASQPRYPEQKAITYDAAANMPKIRE